MENHKVRDHLLIAYFWSGRGHEFTVIIERENFFLLTKKKRVIEVADSDSHQSIDLGKKVLLFFLFLPFAAMQKNFLGLKNTKKLMTTESDLGGHQLSPYRFVRRSRKTKRIVRITSIHHGGNCNHRDMQIRRCEGSHQPFSYGNP